MLCQTYRANHFHAKKCKCQKSQAVPFWSKTLNVLLICIKTVSLMSRLLCMSLFMNIISSYIPFWRILTCSTLQHNVARQKHYQRRQWFCHCVVHGIWSRTGMLGICWGSFHTAAENKNNHATVHRHYSAVIKRINKQKNNNKQTKHP